MNSEELQANIKAIMQRPTSSSSEAEFVKLMKQHKGIKHGDKWLIQTDDGSIMTISEKNKSAVYAALNLENSSKLLWDLLGFKPGPFDFLKFWK